MLSTGKGDLFGQADRGHFGALYPVNGQTNEWETCIITGNGYSANAWPAALATILSVSYYDSYTDIPGLPTAYDKQSNPNYNKMTTGLLTATKVNVLGSTDMLWTVPYYDNDGRIVTSYKQHYLGGTSAYSAYNFDVDSTLYNFNDQPTRLIRRHYAKNVTNTAATLYLTTTDYYTYDHMGRKRRDQNQLRHRGGSSQPVMILSDYTYSEIGQLRAKRLHSINSGSNYLQRLDYRYNPRGWLSYINNADLAADGGITNSDTNDQFGMELSYETTATSRPQYNGNIAGVKWKAGPANGVAQPQYSYDYGYDKINRLTEGESSTSGTKNKNYSEYLQYNTMGNIQKLGRYELVGATRTQIDSLSYSYNGHQLHRVDDASGYTGPGGFSDPVQVDNEYTYDGNGNLRKDQNKGISLITYNVLNLPQNITINGNTVSYTYDATGKKLRKIYTAGSVSDTTQYINGIQYSGNNIDFVQTEEGRARRSGTSYIYEYDLKDHLGNTRVTLKADPNDATDITPLVLQQNSYYPFGASIRSLEPIVSMPKNEYLYNGKELQEETGLYDYGARFYDPVIGRMTSIDPKAELSRRFSTYTYGNDNPIRFIDPDGMFSTDVTENKDGTYKVVGAKADGDKNVYVRNAKGQRTGEVIGQTVTDHSFLSDNGKAVVGATIDLSDKSGQSFLNNLMGDKNLGLFSYMNNAKGGQKYDFKTTGPNGEVNWMKGNVAPGDQAAYTYRGGTVDGVPGLSGGNGLPTIASARDIGNIGAGFVAGSNGMSWSDARLGFDALQSKQQGQIAVEGQPTQMAQRVGYGLGVSAYKTQHPFKSLFKIEPGMPVH